MKVFGDLFIYLFFVVKGDRKGSKLSKKGKTLAYMNQS